MTTVKDIKYLIDSPVEGSTLDSLEHKSIAQTLGDVIAKWKHGDGPFTVGLFGNWGTGKSGIGRILRTEFIDQRTTAIVEFDVWKYESDSFRRQFLLFLNGKDGLNTGLEELRRIYEAWSWKEERENIKPTKSSLVEFLVPIALVIVGIALLFISSKTGSNPEVVAFLNPFLQVVGGILAVAGFQASLYTELFKMFAKWFFSSMKGILKVQEINVSENRIEFAEQFERLFDAIIQKKLDEGFEKVVIIIDNLDRVSDEKILELLSSVKTFLEHKQVAFLIQCDEKAIKRHLLHIYHKENGNEQSLVTGGKYTDEFLRKFFNTYVRIPPLLPGDLDRYAGTLIAETKLPISDEQTRTDLLAVISSAHRDSPNPRKIKQFINALVSNYLLAYYREKADPPILRPEGVVCENVQMLAKTMIIEQKYPDLFDLLQQEPGVWNVLDRSIVEGVNPSDTRLNLLLKDREGDSAYNFLMRTKFITTSNISPFIFLKQSANSQKISTNAEKLTEALQDADEKKVEELLKDVGSGNINDFQDYILEDIGNVKSSSVRVYNIVNSLFSSKWVKHLSFSRAFYDGIAAYILESSSGYQHFIEGFKLPVLFEFVMPNTAASNRKLIAEEYIKLIKMYLAGEQFRVNIDGDKYLHQLIVTFASHPDLFTDAQRKAISQILAESRILDDLDSSAIFFTSPKARDAYINDPIINRVIGSLGTQDLDAVDEEHSVLLKKVRAILGAEAKVKPGSANSLMLKFTEFFSHGPVIGEDKVALLVNKAIKDTLLKLGKLISVDQITNLAQRLRPAYDQNGNDSVRTALSTNLLLLRVIAVNNTDTDPEPLKQYTSDVLNALPTEAIKIIMVDDLKLLNAVGVVANEYRSQLESRAMSQKDLYQLLADNYTETFLEPFLARVIKDSSLYPHAVNKVADLATIINKELLGNCTLSRARREGYPDTMKLLEILPKIGYKIDEFKEIVVTHLLTLLQNQNAEAQHQTGLLVTKYSQLNFFKKSDLEKLTELTVEYLARQGLNNPGSYYETLGILSRLPMSSTTHEKYVKMILGQMAVSSLQDTRAITSILEWAKEAGATYAHNNTDLYEALYLSLKSQPTQTQEMVARLVIEKGLVDRRSKNYYERMDVLANTF